MARPRCPRLLSRLPPHRGAQGSPHPFPAVPQTSPHFGKSLPDNQDTRCPPPRNPHKSQSLHCRATKPEGSAYEFKFGEGKRALTQHAPCSREQPGRGNEWWKLKSLSLRSAQRVPLAALAVRRGVLPPRCRPNASLAGHSSAWVPVTRGSAAGATHDARQLPTSRLRPEAARFEDGTRGARGRVCGEMPLSAVPRYWGMGAGDTPAGFLLPK